MKHGEDDRQTRQARGRACTTTKPTPRPLRCLPGRARPRRRRSSSWWLHVHNRSSAKCEGRAMGGRASLQQSQEGFLPLWEAQNIQCEEAKCELFKRYPQLGGSGQRLKGVKHLQKVHNSVCNTGWTFQMAGQLTNLIIIALHEQH